MSKGFGRLRAELARRTGLGGHRAIFSDLYRRRAWGEAETASGPGSTRARAADFVPELIELLRGVGTRTLLDAPCGDFNWIAPVADAVESYVGVDVVPGLVRENRLRFGGAGRAFLCRDLARDPLPRADVVLCRDCLVHFSLADAWRALRNLRASGSAWLLATTFTAHRPNADVRTGGWRPLNLREPPFGFPAPAALVDERCTHSDGRWRDKALALWRFADLPAWTGVG